MSFCFDFDYSTNFQFPLMSKSRKLQELITEQEKNQTSKITVIHFFNVRGGGNGGGRRKI